jgi:hypothetical protein
MCRSSLPVIPIPLSIASRDKGVSSMWPSTAVEAVEKAAEAVCTLVEGTWSSAGYRGDDLGRRVEILGQDQRYWTKWKSFNFDDCDSS